MGLVNSKVALRNPRLPGLAEVEVDVLVDSTYRAQRAVEAADTT